MLSETKNAFLIDIFYFFPLFFLKRIFSADEASNKEIQNEVALLVSFGKISKTKNFNSNLENYPLQKESFYFREKILEDISRMKLNFDFQNNLSQKQIYFFLNLSLEKQIL